MRSSRELDEQQQADRQQRRKLCLFMDAMGVLATRRRKTEAERQTNEAYQPPNPVGRVGTSDTASYASNPTFEEVPSPGTSHMRHKRRSWQDDNVGTVVATSCT